MGDITRWVHVRNETVVNISLWDGVSPYYSDDEMFAVFDDTLVGIGWTYTDGTFTPPPTPDDDSGDENPE